MIPMHGTLKLLLWTALLIVLVAASACNRRVDSPFPGSNEAPGWVKSAETRSFSASELWNYIDGDADRYIKAGVQTAFTSDYKFEDKFEAVADVYVMGSTAGARKIFESETASQSQPVQMGEAGRLYSGSLVFCKGRSLVRVVAYKEGPEVQQALERLGQAIEKRVAP